MKYLKIIICFLFFPLIANGKAEQDSIRLALKHMEDGLKTKEIAVAQKSFAPEFSISIYSLPFASGLLKQIMEGITFQSIQPDWKGMKTKGNVTSLEVRFTLAGGQKEKSMIAFNESGKILFVDVGFADHFLRRPADKGRKSLVAENIPEIIVGSRSAFSDRGWLYHFVCPLER